MSKTTRISRTVPCTAALLSMAILAGNLGEAAAQWGSGNSGRRSFSSPQRSSGGGQQHPHRLQYGGRGDGYHGSHSSRGGSSSSSGVQWDAIIRGTLQGLQELQRSSQSHNHRPRYESHRPRYTPQPSYQPRNYQPQYYQPTVPQNTYQPSQTVNNVPPKNTLPAKPQRDTARRTDHPSNKRAIQTYLTSAQEEAIEESVNQADQLVDAAKDQLLEDPKLKDKINGDRDVRAALKEFEETGNPAALEALRNDPNTPDSVKEKIDLVIQSTELREDLRDGLSTSSTDRRLKRLRDRIDDSTTLTQAEKRKFRDSLNDLKSSNDHRKIIDYLAEGGQGGGADGGFTSIPPTVISPGGPLFVEEPLSDSEAAAVSSGVVLRNPESNGTAISYLLGGKQFTMESGYSQRLETSYVIEFDRGGDFGTARYTIADGTFEFTLTDRGWDLRKKTYEVTIDNSRFPADFSYLLDGQEYSVKRGEVRRHSSAYPMLMEFDRGDGSEPARKQLFGGTFLVGVDANQARIDLFDKDRPDTGLTNADRYDPAPLNNDPFMADLIGPLPSLPSGKAVITADDL